VPGRSARGAKDVLKGSAPRRRDDGQFVDRFPQFRTPEDYNAMPEALLVDAAGSRRSLGAVTAFAAEGPRGFLIGCGADAVRVQFWRRDIVRIWVAWGGRPFEDPATETIVVGEPEEGLRATWRDAGDHLEMAAPGSGGALLKATKNPMKLSMFRDGVELWSELEPLAKNLTATFQTLAAGEGERFFGGGMQNGRWSHAGQKIRISVDYNWDEGGNPNAAPFYLSTAGYGVYRNTWAPGYYDFAEELGAPAPGAPAPRVVLAHNESRFDAFYFAAAPRDFRGVLEGYTAITGRPFMPPIYGLGLGDSDCYHNGRHGNSTYAAWAVADKYNEQGMPGAWMLVNDGYGCGVGAGPEKFPHNFTALDEVVARERQKGFVTGLWSSTGLPNISREVQGSGARVFKTDVGWIGDGYEYAFKACEQVAAGIEENSDARRFVWTVEGWAGTQRLAVMWTGDNTGSFEYIRWQIPTFVGCGFSAQAHVSGDIDGIFGGRPETYVRDLQFKCLTTTIMSMSGWATNPDKQPWTWGEPYTSINRMYLRLKQRLTPYLYSLSREAHDTGFPIVRALAMEFPEDDGAFEVKVGTTYSFMAGPYLLVAPVYVPLAVSGVRDGIYLPPGRWVDFWTGDVHEGRRTLDGYPAPLETLPLFVRAGAILPMWPEAQPRGRPVAEPLTLEIYPSGNTSFSLYEDDGVTRQALEAGRYAWTKFSCAAPEYAGAGDGTVEVALGAAVGDFEGRPPERSYRLRVRVAGASGVVLLGRSRAEALPAAGSLAELDFLGRGYFFNRNVQRGILHVLTGPLPTREEFRVRLSRGAGASPQQAVSASGTSTDCSLPRLRVTRPAECS